MILKLALVALKITLVLLASSIPVLHAAGNLTWRPHPTVANEYLLYDCNGKTCTIIGGYNAAQNIYRPFANGAYGPPQPLDPTIPQPPVSYAQATNNYGINTDELANYKGPRNVVNGSPATAQQALAKLAAIADDSEKPYLTIIGSPETCEQITQDLRSNEKLQALANQWRLKCYTPQDVMAVGRNFVTSGNPTIYLQDTTGKVLHRQQGYNGPNELIVALTAAKPNYDPAKDPNLNKPETNTVNLDDILKKLSSIPSWGWIIAIVAALALLTTKKQSPQ